MALSVFDLFKVGVGPSSSHTVGPMRAAGTFLRELRDDGLLRRVTRVTADLYGSLGATGRGHGTDSAVLMGFAGELPETVDPRLAHQLLEEVGDTGRLALLGEHEVSLDAASDVVLHLGRSLPLHPNGMTFTAWSGAEQLAQHTYYSVGGGFIMTDPTDDSETIDPDARPLRHPFTTGAELLRICDEEGLSIDGVMEANELSWRSRDETHAGLLHIWDVMKECVRNGMENEGILPGGLHVRRRAPGLWRQLEVDSAPDDPLRGLDWIALYALAVNEENAAGGRVVTAPTNGAAGTIPAVLHYYTSFVPGASDRGVVRFLLTAAAIGMLVKANASISGAEVGCQGEVGVGLLDGCGSVVRGHGRHTRHRSRTPPRSAWSTTWASPATRSAGSSRFPASNATPWRRSRRSPPRAPPSAATAITSSASTPPSARCATPGAT